MANILTAAEAAAVLRCDSTDAGMLALLPQVDAHIRNATGHDWTADLPILSEAKAAARMLIVKWHEDPGMIVSTGSTTGLSFGLTSSLIQLEVIALRYRNFYGSNGSGSVSLPGASIGDTVSTLVGLIGISGDQKASFESVITVDDQIQQISTNDLSEMMFRAYLIPPESL